MARVLILQGANMHLLGIRQPELYGTTSAAELDKTIRTYATEKNIDVDIIYTNSEAEFIDRASSAVADKFDAIVSNTGSFCYGSYPIRDCFSAIPIPVVEVHISNQLAREIHSVTAQGATAVVMGVGHDSYLIGLDAAVRLVRRKVPA
jgi:3-dehydroquinate dehydratase-2